MYHLHMSKQDIENSFIRDVNWLHGRLNEQKKKEQEERDAKLTARK